MRTRHYRSIEDIDRDDSRRLETPWDVPTVFSLASLLLGAATAALLIYILWRILATASTFIGGGFR
jgi:hypothetical protein